MKSNAETLREIWEKRGNKNIRYSDRPKNDLIDCKISDRKLKYSVENLKSIEERYLNIIDRFRDFAGVLEYFWIMYRDKYENYGDALLAFISQNLVRGWPWTDIQFHSEEAWKIIQETSPNCNPTGIYDSEINDQSFLDLRKRTLDINKNKPMIVYEHWTPMSLFRDSFIIAKETNIQLTKEDFFEMLVKYYRVVRISSNEDTLLEEKKYRSNRPLNAYDKLNIIIHEKELWDKLNNYNHTLKYDSL